MNRTCRKRSSIMLMLSTTTVFALALAEVFFKEKGGQAVIQSACRSKFFRGPRAIFQRGASPVHSSGGAFVFPYA